MSKQIWLNLLKSKAIYWLVGVLIVGIMGSLVYFQQHPLADVIGDRTATCAAKPKVSITASSLRIPEANGTSRVTVTRTGGDRARTLKVYVDRSGTATLAPVIDAPDYTSNDIFDVNTGLPITAVGTNPVTDGFAVIPAGQTSMSFTLKANPDTVAEGDETAILTVRGGAAQYDPDPAKKTVTVTITEAGPTPTPTPTPRPTPTGTPTATPTPAGTYTVTVHVINGLTNQPFPNVPVTMDNANQKLTNSNGDAVYSAIPSGSHTFKAQLTVGGEGATDSKTITVTSNTTVNLTVRGSTSRVPTKLKALALALDVLGLQRVHAVEACRQIKVTVKADPSLKTFTAGKVGTYSIGKQTGDIKLTAPASTAGTTVTVTAEDGENDEYLVGFDSDDYIIKPFPVPSQIKVSVKAGETKEVVFTAVKAGYIQGVLYDGITGKPFNKAAIVSFDLKVSSGYGGGTLADSDPATGKYKSPILSSIDPYDVGISTHDASFHDFPYSAVPFKSTITPSADPGTRQDFKIYPKTAVIHGTITFEGTTPDDRPSVNISILDEENKPIAGASVISKDYKIDKLPLERDLTVRAELLGDSSIFAEKKNVRATTDPGTQVNLTIYPKTGIHVLLRWVKNAQSRIGNCQLNNVLRSCKKYIALQEILDKIKELEPNYINKLGLPNGTTSTIAVTFDLINPDPVGIQEYVFKSEANSSDTVVASGVTEAKPDPESDLSFGSYKTNIARGKYIVKTTSVGRPNKPSICLTFLHAQNGNTIKKYTRVNNIDFTLIDRDVTVDPSAQVIYDSLGTIGHGDLTNATVNLNVPSC